MADDDPEVGYVDVDFPRRTVYLSGDVTTEMAHKSVQALLQMDAVSHEPIRVVLNSNGGDEDLGYAIYDAMRMVESDVVVDGFGRVHSIAAAIFQGGDRRRMAEHAIYLIHNGTVALGEVDVGQIPEVAAYQLERATAYYEILAKASGQSLDTIEAWCREEKHFTATAAMEAGFCDEVISASPPKRPRKRRGK